MEKRQAFNKWCWINWIANRRKMKFDPNLPHYIKFYTEWIVSKGETLNYMPFRKKHRRNLQS